MSDEMKGKWVEAVLENERHKPRVFPVTEQMQRIRDGAMADEDEYPSILSDASDFGPVMPDEFTRSTQKSTSEKDDLSGQTNLNTRSGGGSGEAKEAEKPEEKEE